MNYLEIPHAPSIKLNEAERKSLAEGILIGFVVRGGQLSRVRRAPAIPKKGRGITHGKSSPMSLNAAGVSARSQQLPYETDGNYRALPIQQSDGLSWRED